MKLFIPMWIGAGLVSMTCACASSSVAPEKVAAPKAQIAAAEEAGAAGDPTAALQLKLANDEYQRAKQLIREGENESAERMLSRASADAQLALELARLESTRREANDALQKINDLKRQHTLIKAN